MIHSLTSALPALRRHGDGGGPVGRAGGRGRAWAALLAADDDEAGWESIQQVKKLA